MVALRCRFSRDDLFTSRAFLPPLPPGEGWGEGEFQKAFAGEGKSFVIPPHPNPLPEGEGTRKTQKDIVRIRKLLC